MRIAQFRLPITYEVSHTALTRLAGSSGIPDEPSGPSPLSITTGASPLPTLESERFQSRTGGKRDGIINFDVRERVVIRVGEVVWTGWTFVDSGLGLFIEGQNWGEVDLRTGYNVLQDSRLLTIV